MSRCMIDSDLLFPSLCCTEKLNAGEDIDHICIDTLLDSGHSFGLCVPTSSVTLLAFLHCSDQKVGCRILRKNVLHS